MFAFFKAIFIFIFIFSFAAENLFILSILCLLQYAMFLVFHAKLDLTIVI